MNVSRIIAVMAFAVFALMPRIVYTKEAGMHKKSSLSV